MPTPMNFHPSQSGRPRAVELSAAQGRRLAELYLATNRTRKEGSMEVAWVLFAEETGLWPWTHRHHRLVGALPTAAVEVLRRAKGLAVLHRQGTKELRMNGAYQQGGMRTHWGEERRLRAGESFSVDDLTRNVGTWVPWPHRGCECSEKYGVRLGRWQTLAVADDATGAVVAVSSVFRHASSYRGADAASLIHQTERHVGMAGFSEEESRWVVEGGVWQSKHALAALGERFHSASGRPGQKLIERWFGAMQTYDAVWNRDLGRQRGENLENNRLWLECRAGKKDPREFFAGFEESQESLMKVIRYMNERETRSDGLYGRWVPQERWERDTAERPLVLRDGANAWVMSPERRPLKVVRRGMLTCQAVLADGVARKLVWNAPELYEHLGRTVDLYFDPLAEHPITGTVVDPRTRKVICLAVCQDSHGYSRDADAERVAAIRRTMLTDLRVILGGNAGHRRTEARGIGGSLTIISDRSDPDQVAVREKEPGSHAPGCPDPRYPTVAARNTTHPEASREGLSLDKGALGLRVGHHPARAGAAGEEGTAKRGFPPELPPGRDGAAEGLRSLGRKAAAAREQEPNF